MSSREIILWIDEHWYEALTKNNKGETMEEQRFPSREMEM